MRHGGSQKKAHTQLGTMQTTHTRAHKPLDLIYESLGRTLQLPDLCLSSLSFYICACVCARVTDNSTNCSYSAKNRTHCSLVSLFPRWILAVSHSSPCLQCPDPAAVPHHHCPTHTHTHPITRAHLLTSISLLLVKSQRLPLRCTLYFFLFVSRARVFCSQNRNIWAQA